MAALVISALSLAVAIAAIIMSVTLARRQIALAARTTQIEIDRRQEEQRPQFEAAIEPMADGVWYVLRLRLVSSRTLTSLGVSLPGDNKFRFSSDQLGVVTELEVVRDGPLVVNESTAWRVELVNGGGGTSRLTVTARAGDELRWTVSVPVEVPYDMAESVF